MTDVTQTDAELIAEARKEVAADRGDKIIPPSMGPHARALIARLANRLEQNDLDAVGCAERDVGRYVYQRIEALMGATDGPEGEELNYLASIAASVEEYGLDACQGSSLGPWPSEHRGRWLAFSTAPRDGTEIEALQADGDEDRICWEASRTCMLGRHPGAGGAGQCGEGWVSALAEYLPVDDVFTHWRLPTPPSPSGGA